MSDNLSRRAMFRASAGLITASIAGSALATPPRIGRADWDAALAEYRTANAAHRNATAIAEAVIVPPLRPMRCPIGTRYLSPGEDLEEMRATLMQWNYFMYLGDGPAKRAKVDEEIEKVAQWQRLVEHDRAEYHRTQDAQMAACRAESDAASVVFETPAPDLAAVIEKIGIAISEGYDIDEMVVIEADLRRLGSN